MHMTFGDLKTGPFTIQDRADKMMYTYVQVLKCQQQLSIPVKLVDQEEPSKTD